VLVRPSSPSQRTAASGSTRKIRASDIGRHPQGRVLTRRKQCPGCAYSGTAAGLLTCIIAPRWRAAWQNSKRKLNRAAVARAATQSLKRARRPNARFRIPGQGAGSSRIGGSWYPRCEAETERIARPEVHTEMGKDNSVSMPKGPRLVVRNFSS
jgi:hypothetical protein